MGRSEASCEHKKKNPSSIGSGTSKGMTRRPEARSAAASVHHMFERELAEHLDVPDEVSLVELLPIGFP